jgi:hypothetical protein
MKTRVKLLKLPIYDCTLTIVETEDVVGYHNRLHKRIPTIGEPFTDDHIEALFITDNADIGKYWIVLPKAAGINTIAHECLHAVFSILGDRAISLPTESEAAAYLQGYITEACWNFLHSNCKEP